jgi:uncharacterized delta-60 repeat protein
MSQAIFPQHPAVVLRSTIGRRQRRGRRIRGLLTMAGVALVISTCSPPAALADAGDLDTTFGGDGRVTAFLTPGGSARAFETAIQADGRIVVVGCTDNDRRFLVARFNSDGTSDETFGVRGRTLTQFNFEASCARAVAIQADGKIVVGGGSGGRFALARYHANGSLDASFGDGGKITTGIDDAASVRGLAIGRSGAIVAAGTTHQGDDEDFAVVRYGPQGRPDSGFSDDGIVTTGLGGSEGGQDVAIQSNGRIVVVGTKSRCDRFLSFCTNRNADFALVRYTVSGALDDDFDGDGKVTTGFGAADSAYGVAIQADGKIVAAGKHFFKEKILDATDFMFALARYNSDGSLDKSFSENGKVRSNVLTGHPLEALSASDVAIAADGKIVAVGAVWGPPDRSVSDVDFEVARYKPNGVLDRSFDGNGLQATEFGGRDFAEAVAVQPDGRIVAVGQTLRGPGVPYITIARYLDR